MNISKQGLASAVAGRTGTDAAHALRIVEATLVEIEAALAAGLAVELRGFASLRVVEKRARLATLPDGRKVPVPGGYRVKFKWLGRPV
jgi:nucleoid DNA-binding protein